MTHATDLGTLARWMASDFTNQQQAFDNPPIFAHVRACMRPLPAGLLDGTALYLEQAYEYNLKSPYRTRVLNLKFTEVDGASQITIENYAIEGKEEFYGASREPERLGSLGADRLTKLPCCDFHVTWTGECFQGTVEEGKGCMVERNGKMTYLQSTFQVFAERFTSLDRGYDPATDERVWGSIAGPFDFHRVTSFAEELNQTAAVSG
ncbi:MAG: chromophore lyase CpcT/CpeT [Geitlerinemataceae cyanobacterium]